MADQVPPQNPPAPAQQPPMAAPITISGSVVPPIQVTVAPPTVTSTAVAAVETGFKATIKELWGKYGIFFILIGILLLVAKFNDIISDVLGWSSKKDLTNAQKTDTELKAQEDAANQQADALVKQANELPSQEKPVGEDWYEKK